MCFGCLVNELYNVPDFERVSYCKKRPEKKIHKILTTFAGENLMCLMHLINFFFHCLLGFLDIFVCCKNLENITLILGERKNISLFHLAHRAVRERFSIQVSSKKNKFIRIIELERKAIEKRAVFHLLPNIRFYWILRLNYWLSTRSSKDWDSWYKTLNRLDFSPVSVLVIKIKFSPLQHAPH